MACRTERGIRAQHSKSSMMTNVFGGSDGRSVVKGTISSAAFASGDQFVIGYWPQSPLGPFHDIMWLDANDTRTLIASSREAANFITSTYHFDHVLVASLHVESEGATTTAWTDRWPEAGYAPFRSGAHSPRPATSKRPSQDG